MNSVEATPYQDVLDVVRNWPATMRFDLLQDLLQTFAPKEEGQPIAKQTWNKALGLLSTDGPAPSDAEVRQWLDEHRMEKYG